MTVADRTAPARTRLSDLARRLWSSVWGPGLLAGLALFGVYMLTLQRIISGSDTEYMKDAGEMQVSLNLWGTPHAPAYPLWAMLGAPLVALQKLLGVNPATAASATSLLWGFAALAITYDLIRRRTGRPWLAAFSVLVLGLVEAIWLHNVVAEVYSLYLLFVAAIFWLVLADENAEWTRKRWLVLAALLGFGAAHHRAIIFLVPALAVYLWPQFWARRRQVPLTLLLGALVFVAGFLPYLYLPLYIKLGGTWYSNRPDTLPGMWRTIAAGQVQTHTDLDYNFIYDPPHNLPDLWAHLTYIGGILARQLTWPGLVAGGVAHVALFFTKGYSRRVALLLALSTLAFVGFVVVFPEAVFPEALILPALLTIGLAAAEAASSLLEYRPRFGWVGGLLALVLAGALFWQNLPAVQSLTRNPVGVEYVRQLWTLEPADRDTYFFATPWGPRYMAMVYALYVTGEVGGFQPIDHIREPGPILARDDRLVTTPDMLYAFSPDWWAGRVGGELYLRAAGPGFVELDDEPLAEAPPSDPIPLDNGVTLLASQLEPAGEGAYELTLYWTAEDPPDINYSVYVHLADALSGGSILRQADSYAPVSGWYPVPAWRPGEIVRDAYRAAVPVGYDGPLYLRVGMYRQLDDGSFENFDAFSQPLP